MFYNTSALCLVVLFCGCISVVRSGSFDSVFFPDEDNRRPSSHHTLPPRTTASVKPKLDHDSGGNHFSVQPSSGGGFSASASLSNSFSGGHATGNNLAASQAASQSHSVNFQVGHNGFSAAQSSSASQAASFNSNFGNQGSSLSASQASSQSSSFSGGGGSASSASSQAAGASFSGGGGAASLASGASNSQSSRRPGYSNVYNPNIISPNYIRNLRPQPGTNRNDRRRRPQGPFYNSWFNPYWNVLARSPKRQ